MEEVENKTVGEEGGENGEIAAASAPPQDQPLGGEHAPPQGQSPYGQPPYGQPVPPAQKKTDPYAVTSLVCGLVSIVCALIPSFGWIVALVTAICAIVFAAVGRKKYGPSVLATAGLVLGIVTLAFALVLFSLFIRALNALIDLL